MWQTACVLATSMLLGQAPATETKPPAEARAVTTAERWGLRVNEAIKAGRQATNVAEEEAAARQLMKVYQELSQAEELDDETQHRLLVMAGHRLARLGDQLVMRLKRAARTAPKATTVSSSASAAKRPAAKKEAAGGGAEADGKKLVELIQETIFPQQWDVNGGDSVVRYFAPRHVLVITASSEVHGGVGNLLRQFK